MLSSAASALTQLILARHTLMCRAIELNAMFDDDAAVMAGGETIGTAERDQSHAKYEAGHSRRCAAAELMLLPALLSNNNAAIADAWERLARTCPGSDI
jgi:hypothetical protein